MPANDLTYTVQGTFSTTKIKLSARLPKLGSHESYSFVEFHNISKTVGATQVNAILVYMTRSNENGTALVWNSITDPLVAIPNITPTTPMVRHALAPLFDWNAQKSLIIVYHEPKTQTDIDDMQREAATIFETADTEGDFNTTWLAHNIDKVKTRISGIDKSGGKAVAINDMFMFFNPRKAGMTIISKP